MNDHHPDSLELVILGTFIQSTWQRHVHILKDAAMGIVNGKIVFLEKQQDLLCKGVTFGKADILQLDENEFLMPGLIDTHAHASQFSFMGIGNGMELLDWLETYTYPVESRIVWDMDFAAEVYKRCVSRSLRSGSTTVCYYGTIGLESTLLLVDTIERLGQRAFVGKVNMDMQSPKTYIEDTHKSVADTRSFIENVMERQNPLITPCVTPRFAVSCTAELMSQLAKLAEEFSLPIQTHISENKSEIEFVMSLFPKSKSYANVYDAAGLLGERTILAHGIYLTSEEIQLIKKRGTSISHCPNSNFCLHSGVLDVMKLLKAGVKVGLGTDFGGGNTASILDTIRRGMEATVVTSLFQDTHVTSQHHASEQCDPAGQTLTYKDMFFLATLGSSQVLGLQDVVGDFRPGKDLDALVVNVAAPGSPIEVFPGETIEERFEKFLFQGDDRNISRVYVRGKNVTPCNSHDHAGKTAPCNSHDHAGKTA